MPHRRWWVAALVLTTSGACGGACGGLALLPQGSVTAPKIETAAALRLTNRGFRVLNQVLAADGGLLAQLSGDAGLKVDIPCSSQPVELLGIGVERLTIADNGRLDAGCNNETCGQMDGLCDSRDAPQQVTLRLQSLTVLPKAPNLVEVTARTTVETGKMFISSVTRGTSPFCVLAGGGPVKCGVDFDSRRAAPDTAELGIEVRLLVDPRWDRLLSFELAAINGSKVCGGIGVPAPPRCIDPNDVRISTEGRCTICSTANFVLLKAILLDQLTAELQKLVRGLLVSANCLPCGASSVCPARSVCRGANDAGTCIDTASNTCVPRLLGVEGVLDVGPNTTGLELMAGVGGSVAANDAGLSLGVSSAVKERAVASCVAPQIRPPPPMLPLPDFDREAPGAYDVGFSLSQQILSEGLFRAQQSGALCIEIGTEQIAQLESSALATLLPSLNKLTEGASVPMRLVVRPVMAPMVSLGANTVDAMGKPLEPLIRFEWPQLELDLYALVAERYARLFTIQTDLALPLGVALDPCGSLRPVIGSLTGALSNVQVKNAELLAEDTSAFNMLVPSLLALAEPALAQGLGVVALPEIAGLPPIRIDSVKGVGAISGTRTFNHLGLYARFTEDAGCGMARASVELDVSSAGGGAVVLRGPPMTEFAVRSPGGLWSEWRRTDEKGNAVYTHPRFWLVGSHQVEVESRDGARSVLQVQVVALESQAKAQ
jgi:hypothetical protein